MIFKNVISFTCHIDFLELPDILQNLLTIVSGSHTLKNWSIYPEKDGSTTFKIRFGVAIGESVNHTENIHFKRKSINQVRRDSQRSSVWRAKQQCEPVQHPGESRNIRSSSNDQPGVVTRSMSQATPIETLRTESIHSSPNYGLHISPLVTDLDLDAPPFTPGELLVPTVDASGVSPGLIQTEISTDNMTDDESSDQELDEVFPNISSPRISPIPQCANCCLSVGHDSPHSSDSCHDSDPRSEHGGDPDDNTEDDDPDYIKRKKSQDWEPPPGWSWSCWLAKPNKCDQHS